MRRLIGGLHGFWHAWMLLTRIPCPIQAPWTDKSNSQAQHYFSILGTLIGCCAALAWYLGYTANSPFTGAILALVCSALITGALHEDGLADTADAFGGGRDQESILNILKDSRLGTYGVLTLILATLLKLSFLLPLSLWEGVISLVLAHTLARIAPLWAMLGSTYASPSTQSKIPLSNQSIAPKLVFPILWGTLCCLGCAYYTSQAIWCLALLVPWALAWPWKRFCQHKLQGYRGDTLGAIEQITEVFVLGFCAFVWKSIL